MNSMKAAEQSSKAAIAHALERAQAEVGSLTNQQLNEMHKLFEELQLDKNTNGLELNILTQQFDKFWQIMIGHAKDNVESSAKKLMNTMDTSPDVVSLYTQSSKPTQNTINEITGSLGDTAEQLRLSEEGLLNSLGGTERGLASKREALKEFVADKNKKLDTDMDEVKGILDAMDLKTTAAETKVDTGSEMFKETLDELGTATVHNDTDLLNDIDASSQEFQ